MKQKKYIVLHNVGKDIKWYVTEIGYYNHPDSDWILSSAIIQQESKAMIFINKERAEKIAKILSDQIDEYGSSGQYYVKEIK